jgi:hypothetical protein
MRLTSVMALLATLPLAGPAFGQAVCSGLSQCACAAPLASFAPGSANLTGMQGSVQVTAVNPGNNPDTALLTIGDSAVSLVDGSAILNFAGSCQAQMGPQSSLVIRAVEGCACAEIVEARTGGGYTTAGGEVVNPTVVAGTVGVLGLAAGATYLLVNNDDDDEGPDSPEGNPQ